MHGGVPTPFLKLGRVSDPLEKKTSGFGSPKNKRGENGDFKKTITYVQ